MTAQDFKSWLFTLNHKELLQTARDNGIDPAQYLTEEQLIDAIAAKLEEAE